MVSAGGGDGGGRGGDEVQPACSPLPRAPALPPCSLQGSGQGWRHTTGAVAVQLLEWQLSNAVLEAFRCGQELCNSNPVVGFQIHSAGGAMSPHIMPSFYDATAEEALSFVCVVSCLAMVRPADQ